MDNRTCEYCEEKKDCEQTDNKKYYLCEEGMIDFDKGENRTGYCSLSCIITGRCDSSC